MNAWIGTMKIINRPRAAGKTHDLIQEFKKDENTLLLVHSVREKDRLRKVYQLDESQYHRVFTYFEKEKIMGFAHRYRILIDNLDLMFGELYPKHFVKLVSINKELNK